MSATARKFRVVDGLHAADRAEMNLSIRSSTVMLHPCCVSIGSACFIACTRFAVRLFSANNARAA